MAATQDAPGLMAGKVVVVAGAGAGIGKAMAGLFVREGAQVVAGDWSGEEEKVAKEIGPACVPFHVDLNYEEQIEAMYAHAEAAFGRVDGVVNVAGTLLGRQPEITVKEFDDMMAVNLRGVMLSCKYAIRAMQRMGGGSIVNISTAGALNAEKMASISYTAAKAGVHSVTKSLAILHGPENIRVNAIANGFALTERFRSMPDSVLDMMRSKAMLGRIADPEEHAQVAAFLLSDRASFVTGTIIPVDGGWSARLP